MRGKPIEFRRYGPYPPHIGTRWDCPTCKTVYFAWWRDAEYVYGRSEIPKFVIDLSYYESFNDEHDADLVEMARVLGAESPSTNLYSEWYKKFPDKEMPIRGPEHARHVCLDDADDVQSVW